MSRTLAAAARVVLKQYRFEVGAAVLAALAVGIWALVVEYRLDALDVPPGCIQDWLWRVDTGEDIAGCAGPMRTWGEILTGQGGIILEGEGMAPFSWMGVLPFAVGLLGGVPIVARELEAGTAQTAWSLNGLRTRWLLRQVMPVAILLGIAVAFAAFAVEAAVEADVAWGGYASFHIGDHGPLVLTRAVGAFGIGLLTGALLGRTLPAFVSGAVLAFALVFAVDMAHDAWLKRLEPTVIAEVSPLTGEIVDVPRTVTTGWGVRTPEGAMISFAEARVIVDAARVAAPDPNDEQDLTALGWLEEHGYTLLPLGVTDEMALGWAPYDALAFGLVGVASIGGAVVLVNRRRPT